MKLNRELQTDILNYLATFYPSQPPKNHEETLLAIADGDGDALTRSLYYLYEQHCISENCLSKEIFQPTPRFCMGLVRITSTGLDVIQEDGGISAIKNTVTVRFHADALTFLEQWISHSSQGPNDKQALVARLRGLPTSAIEHLMKKILDAAVGHLPDACQLIDKLLR